MAVLKKMRFHHSKASDLSKNYPDLNFETLEELLDYVEKNGKIVLDRSLSENCDWEIWDYDDYME